MLKGETGGAEKKALRGKAEGAEGMAGGAEGTAGSVPRLYFPISLLGRRERKRRQRLSLPGRAAPLRAPPRAPGTAAPCRLLSAQGSEEAVPEGLCSPRVPAVPLGTRGDRGWLDGKVQGRVCVAERPNFNLLRAGTLLAPALSAALMLEG